jgi:hypothetical protein
VGLAVVAILMTIREDWGRPGLSVDAGQTLLSATINPGGGMSDYTIEGYWKRRLTVVRPQSVALVEGWFVVETGLDTFREAPLAHSSDFGNGDPNNSSILLVSAPGAVGKSTLARQIAFATGAVLIDLAKAAPVGANTLSGGLVRSGLYNSWEAGTTAVLIDGLDEARLRVTQQAFEAFLSDVGEISIGRPVPTVLFGRTGAAQDAWLVLEGKGLDVPVIEIGYFDRDSSIDFAEATLQAGHPTSHHRTVQRKAIELLVDRLRVQTESDGDRFSGYAPVLQAVAARVAQEGNPAALVAEIEKGEQLVTLKTIVSAILERERGKISTLPFDAPKLAETLYSPEEQLDRLVARVYQSPPPYLPPMGPRDAQTYSTALETWVAEHPFLDGASRTSSAVFDAVISTRALHKSGPPTDAALERELRRGAAANPFLSEFYMPEGTAAEPVRLPSEHIGIVYSSLRARLALGDTASLLVEGAEDADEEEALRAEVEVTFVRRGEERARTLLFYTEQIGAIRLGAHIEDVDVTVPHARVEIGPGSEAILIAPVSIQCAILSLTTDKLIVECPSGANDAAVYLEANEFSGEQMSMVPSCVVTSLSRPLGQGFEVMARGPQGRLGAATTADRNAAPSIRPQSERRGIWNRSAASPATLKIATRLPVLTARPHRYRTTARRRRNSGCWCRPCT